MEQLVKEYKIVVPHCFVGLYHEDLTCSCYIYKVSHKVMWHSWISYDVRYYIPYINDPTYDGEYNTNTRLQIARKELRRKADIFIAYDKLPSADNVTEEHHTIS